MTTVQFDGSWLSGQGRLTPEDLQTVTFPGTRLGRRGYEEEPVRAFLRLVHAEVTRLTTGGKAVTLKDRFGPLMVGGIEIGDLEIEFSHPTLGKRIEKIAAAQLRDGKTYQINGNMKDAKLRVAELP